MRTGRGKPGHSTPQKSDQRSSMIYPCYCHVCGREFDHEAEFMSGSASIIRDGVERAVITCNVEPSLPPHTPAEVRESWMQQYGMPRVPGNGMLL